MQTHLSWLLFPLTMSAALGACLWLVAARGFSFETASTLVVVASMGWIFAWERFLPFRERWNETDADVGTDTVHFFVQVVMTKALRPLLLLALLPVVSSLGDRWGNEALWPTHWPLIAQLFWMLLIAEFGRYWVHRAAHRFAPLWRFHAVHHSPNRLYWLNAGRFHPVEKAFFLLPETVPFILMNTPDAILGLYVVFNTVHGLFQHSNIRIRLGPLNYIFSLTELHRWHHSKIIAESDTNFGNNLIFWDLVFGTFFWPRDREVGPIGVMNPEYPKTYLGQLAAPFGAMIDKPADYEERKAFYTEQALREADTPDQASD